MFPGQCSATCLRLGDLPQPALLQRGEAAEHLQAAPVELWPGPGQWTVPLGRFFQDGLGCEDLVEPEGSTEGQRREVE